MNENENRIKKIISEVAELDNIEIDNEADLVDDLGVDSMMAIEILTELEKEFMITISDQEIKKFANVSAILSIVNNILENK